MLAAARAACCSCSERSQACSTKGKQAQAPPCCTRRCGGCGPAGRGSCRSAPCRRQAPWPPPGTAAAARACRCAGPRRSPSSAPGLISLYCQCWALKLPSSSLSMTGQGQQPCQTPSVGVFRQQAACLYGQPFLSYWSTVPVQLCKQTRHAGKAHCTSCAWSSPAQG